MRKPPRVMMGVLVLGAMTALTPLSWSAPVIVEESARLQSPGASAGLGGAVAIYGNHLIAGSEVPLDGEFVKCVTLLFERPTATGAWSYTAQLTNIAVADDRGGCHLAVAAAANTVGVSVRDHAFVYERTSTGWLETQLPLPPDRTDFASDIALANDFVVVGGVSSQGVAGFIYRRSAVGQWAFESTVVAGAVTRGDNDYLGESVATDGRSIVIGKPDPGSGLAPGLLYVFRRAANGQWFKVDALHDDLTPVSAAAGGDVTVATPTPGVGVAAYTDGRGGASIFRESSPDVWSNLDNVRPLNARIGPFTGVFGVDLNTLPGPVGLATSQPFAMDRGADSGSVTVYAPKNGFEVFEPVVKFLASDARPGLLLGRSMSFQGDTLAATGGDRVYVFRVPANLAQPAIVQDDFADANAAGWIQSSPTWTVPVSRGSRVYRQNSTTDARFTTLSQINRSNVAIEADVRPVAFNGSDRWVGLLARHVDSQHYYYVSLRNNNTLRLARRIGDSFTTLASTALTVTPNRNYHVRLEAVGTWLRVYIDGRLRLQARDTTFKQGSVGFRTHFAQAEFDNVLVSPNPALTLLADDFEEPGFLQWKTTPSANWSVVASGANHVLRQAVASGRTFAIAGIPYDAAQPEAADQIIAARVRAISFSSGTNPWFGLIARYRDNANYMLITVNRNGYITLSKINSGAVQVFDSALLTVTAGTWYALRLEAVDDRLRVYVNGSLALEGRDPVVDPASTRGRYGLITAGTAAEFDDVTVTQP
jgi:hypothetical protein